MNSVEVRVVNLSPAKFVSFYGYGETPETIAWEKLIAFASPVGYLDNRENHRIFGFNNPDPSPGSPNYGYEVWIEVVESAEPKGDLKIVDFTGGMYAVTRCEVRGNAYDVIPETWKRLLAWREDSEYKAGNYQWLEEFIHEEGIAEGDFTLDLYLPIDK